MTSAEAFALLASQQNLQVNIHNLKTKLQAHNIWIWKKGTIETHLNLQSKTESEWANFVNQVKTNSLTTTLPNDHAEIQDCINWLLN
ncbi:hypothetical protein [Carboxylicivirga marina]|uniref:hypothetical protein n=1 Tax=Carboxylicivirga marina TaxID=2800988 RepID=UPI00259A59DD|nr:hypothetical protein [uncultured Carboxylicivirga sp.]